MSVSLYQITVPSFIEHLKNLKNLLAHGVKYAGTPDKEQTLLDARLIGDMQALPYQIQRISDCAKGVAVRMGGAEPQAWADDEKTFPELQARLDKTIAILESLDGKFAEGAETKMVEFGSYKFDGTSYIQRFAIPNFFFHYVIAYGLLRKEGVPIGKKDYLGVGEKLL